MLRVAQNSMLRDAESMISEGVRPATKHCSCSITACVLLKRDQKTSSILIKCGLAKALFLLEHALLWSDSLGSLLLHSHKQGSNLHCQTQALHARHKEHVDRMWSNKPHPSHSCSLCHPQLVTGATTVSKRSQTFANYFSLPLFATGSNLPLHKHHEQPQTKYYYVHTACPIPKSPCWSNCSAAHGNLEVPRSPAWPLLAGRMVKLNQESHSWFDWRAADGHSM